MCTLFSYNEPPTLAVSRAMTLSTLTKLSLARHNDLEDMHANHREAKHRSAPCVYHHHSYICNPPSRITPLLPSQGVLVEGCHNLLPPLTFFRFIFTMFFIIIYTFLQERWPLQHSLKNRNKGFRIFMNNLFFLSSHTNSCVVF